MESASYPRIITDESLMETQEHGQDGYPFRFYEERMSMFDFHCVDWHWHQELEFVYLQEGELEVTAGEESFTLHAGEGLFINTKILHRLYSAKEAVIPNFVFAASLLAPEDSLLFRKYMEPFLNSPLSCFVFRENVKWQRKVLSCMQEIIEEQRRKEPDELETVRTLWKLWALLYKNVTNDLIPESDRHTAASRARIALMLQYIQQNYMHEVSLYEIATAANISKSTALNLFKRNLKTTPVDYLISYRMGKAADSLRASERKIGRIAAEAGFENVDYFCRVFKKKYGMTPTEYRKRF